jgi:hypothetical protein
VVRVVAAVVAVKVVKKKAKPTTIGKYRFKKGIK